MPHAMFNLSVVYFTYLPDHWCKVERIYLNKFIISEEPHFKVF